MARGRKPQSSSGPGSPFRPGAVCLEFGYTGGFSTGLQHGERLRGPEDLTQWLRQRVCPTVAAADDRDVAHALDRRGCIVDVAHALAYGNQVPEDELVCIDALAARPGIPAQIDAPGAVGPLWPVERALATIAGNAAVTLSSRWIRVRVCAAEDCDLIFYDSSAGGARRWCSMRRCGNRAKVRAHRARKATTAVS